MAVDLTTGSYDKSGIFSKYGDISTTCEERTVEGTSLCLKNFSVAKVLKESSSKKTVVVEGRFAGDERPAIIVVEKQPIDTRDLSQLFSKESRLELKFRNNIYANYHVYLQNGFNGINVQVIYPAREEDFLKFVDVPIVMINETMAMYESVTKPFFTAENLQASESMSNITNSDNKTIFSDSSDNASFVLEKDVIDKCSCSGTHFRAKAIVSHNHLLSLRDLTAFDIPLLIRLKEKCLEQLSTKYNITTSKIESYIFYPPTTFPFHIFFETLEKDVSIPAEKAHHLDTVIANLQLIPDYYQKITLTYSLPENGALSHKISEYKLLANHL